MLSPPKAAAPRRRALSPPLTGGPHFGPGPPAPAGRDAVLDELATLEWIEKADVAALREGVIETVELRPGMPVSRGGDRHPPQGNRQV